MFGLTIGWPRPKRRSSYPSAAILHARTRKELDRALARYRGRVPASELAAMRRRIIRQNRLR